MEIYKQNKELISLKYENRKHPSAHVHKDEVLCVHCKRTSNNGIRCLGMCVADSDY